MKNVIGALTISSMVILSGCEIFTNLNMTASLVPQNGGEVIEDDGIISDGIDVVTFQPRAINNDSADSISIKTSADCSNTADSGDGFYTTEAKGKIKIDGNQYNVTYALCIDNDAPLESNELTENIEAISMFQVQNKSTGVDYIAAIVTGTEQDSSQTFFSIEEGTLLPNYNEEVFIDINTTSDPYEYYGVLVNIKCKGKGKFDCHTGT